MFKYLLLIEMLKFQLKCKFLIKKTSFTYVRRHSIRGD